MDLELKHIQEKTKICFTLALMCNLTMLITGIVEPNKSGMIVRTIVSAMVLVFILFSKIKMKASENIMHLYLYSLLVQFVFYVFSSQDIYTYAIMYALALTVVLFLDKGFSIRGAIGCISVMLIKTIVLIIGIFRGSGQDLYQVIYNFIFCVVACIVAMLVTSIVEKHNKEDMQQVRDSADAQLQTSEKVLSASNSISSQLDGARGLVTNLIDAIGTSNLSVNEIAASIKTTAEAIESQTAMTSDIQDALSTAGERATEAQESSKVTLQAVVEGADLLADLKTQAIESAEINNSTKVTTEQLNDRIKEVEAIIGTILNISDQTNLLALNASIEAARAGEAGKGFAVVADEIRNLSEETKNSTEQITSIINKLTIDVENASSNMAKSAASSEKQNEMIEITSAKFETIRTEMDKLSDNVDGISADVAGIVKANEEIMDSISNISATSEEVAASSESSIAVSDDSKRYMDEMNTVLEEIFGVSNDMKAIVGNEGSDEGSDEVSNEVLEDDDMAEGVFEAAEE